MKSEHERIFYKKEVYLVQFHTLCMIRVVFCLWISSRGTIHSSAQADMRARALFTELLAAASACPFTDARACGPYYATVCGCSAAVGVRRGGGRHNTKAGPRLIFSSRSSRQFIVEARSPLCTIYI